MIINEPFFRRGQIILMDNLSGVISAGSDAGADGCAMPWFKLSISQDSNLKVFLLTDKRKETPDAANRHGDQPKGCQQQANF